jgi:soluble lytic murein transglycosylase-like protein
MADPVIIDMTESEFNRIYGGGSGSTPAPTPVGASPSIAPVAPMMAPQQSGGMVQPIIIDMPESEYRMRFGTMGENALQGIKDIPSSIMSIPENLYGVAKGTAGALSTMSAGGEVAPSDKMALRNLGSLAGGTAGGLAGAKAGALMGTPLGPWGMAAGGLAGGAVGGALGLLGVDWAAEQAGVDAPRTTQERLNSLAYNTTQGFGSDLALRGAGKVARDVTVPFAKITTKSGQEAAAANVMDRVYGPGAISQIDNAQQALKGDPLGQLRPTAELVGTEGAAQLQKQLEMEGFGGPIGEKNIVREAARKAQLESMAPDTARIEDVQQTVSSNIDNLRYEARAADAQLPSSIDPVVAGSVLRELAEKQRGISREGVQGAFAAIPDSEVKRFAPSADLQTSLGRLKEYFGPGSEGAPKDVQRMVETLNPELKPVPQVDATTRMLQEIQGVTPKESSPLLNLDYLQRLRRWAGEEANQYFNKGENRAGSVAQAVVNDIDAGLEQAVKDGTMPKAQADAYRGALKAHKEMMDTFDLGPTGRILQRGQGTTGYNIEPTNVGRQFWNSNAEAMKSFDRALGGDAAAAEVLSRDAITDFRQAITGMDGKIAPSKVKGWIDDHSAFLDAFPEIKTKVNKIFDNEAAAAAAEKGFKKFAEANPEQAASVLLSGPNSISKVRALKKELGNNPDLLDGVRRGTIDTLTTNLYSIADLKAKPSALKRFMDKNGGAMRELFSPDQMKVLEQIYDDFGSEVRLEESAARASRGQSATAQKTNLAAKLKDQIMDEFGIAGKVISQGSAMGGVLGGVAGSGAGWTGSTLGVAAGGYLGKQVSKLAERAQNAALATLAKAAADPEFAKLLLSKATPDRMSAAMKILNPKLSPIRSLLVTGALITRQDSAKAAQSLANMIAPAMQSYQAIPQQMRDLASAVMQNPSAVPTEAPPIIGGAAQRTSTAGDVSIDGGAVDPRLIDAMAMVESSNNPNAVGPRTRYGQAKGRLQLLDSTGKELFKKLGLSGKYDPFNAEQNTTIATAYMGQLADRYDGSIPLALAAYNYGMGNLDNAIARIGQSGPREIQEFLEQEVKNRMRAGQSQAVAKRAAAAALIDTYGPTVLNRYLPKETRNYISKILSIYESGTETPQQMRA